MNEAIDRAVPLGNVAAILKAVDIPGLRSRDHRGFVAAKTGWARLQFEAVAIERNTDIRRERGRLRGRENAAFPPPSGSPHPLSPTPSPVQPQRPPAPPP